MSNRANAAELLQNLLDDRYAEGYATGNKAGYAAGRDAGYTQALDDIADVISAKLSTGEQGEPSVGPSLADHPGDENDAEPDEAQPPEIVGLQPNFRRALEYLQQHPGMTAHEARDVVRNRNAFRMLHRLGLVEKRGSQFFPKNAEAPR